jgi:hypothetical protein
MAGYSGTPLPQKLGIKPGHRVALIDAPAGFQATLGTLPAEVSVITTLPRQGELDVVLFFTDSRAELARRFQTLARRLSSAGAFWICWPKKASAIPTDLTEAVVRAIGLETGLVDNKVCAVDETWSGLRFVIRLTDRPGRRRQE